MSVGEKIDHIIDELNELKSIIPPSNPKPLIPSQYWDFLGKIKIVIYGQTRFERTIDFTSPYVRLFHAQDCGSGNSMVLIGVEDRDPGLVPDGWTDILLPIFYTKGAPNHCNILDDYLFYVDMSMSGAYKKELWFHSGGKWKKLYRYSVQEGGLFIGDTNVKVSVGYIEYYPKEDTVCFPKV